MKGRGGREGGEGGEGGREEGTEREAVLRGKIWEDLRRRVSAQIFRPAGSHGLPDERGFGGGGDDWNTASSGASFALKRSSLSRTRPAGPAAEAEESQEVVER